MQLFDPPLGNRAFTLPNILAAAQHTQPLDDIGHVHRIRQSAVPAEWAQDVDDGTHVVDVRHGEGARHVRLRGRREPDTHFGDDAEVGLEEEALYAGAEAEFGEVAGRRGVDCELACADDVAVCEHGFEAADVLVVGGGWGEACAAVEGVSDDGAPAEGGDGGPEGEVVVEAVIVEVCEGDAWFDDGVGEFGVDGEDAVHAVEVEGEGAGDAGGRPAVAGEGC